MTGPEGSAGPNRVPICSRSEGEGRPGEGITGGEKFEGSLDVVDEVCLSDYVDHDPILGDRDREGVKRTIASYRAAFPDLTFTVEDAFAADDKVVLHWSAEGTFENEFMGQSPTGETGEPVAGIGIDRYEGDKIA